MAGAFRWFLDRYVSHVTSQVSKRSEKVRQMQAESGRTHERVVRYEILEADVNRRDIEQRVHIFAVRIGRDGSFTRLPDHTRPDVTVYTDLPTVWGVARGSYTLNFKDGTSRLLQPFTVFDAVRLGKVEWGGTSSTLSELMLFERKVAPEFLASLKLPALPGG